MKKEPIKNYRESADELRRFLQTGKYRNMQAERAFIEWYIEARFGLPDSKRIVDGKEDGGLDAIVENKGVVFVFQFKYQTTAKASLVTQGETKPYEAILTYFRESDNEQRFFKWLDKVRPQLRPIYSNLRDVALERPGDVRFIFVTTKRCGKRDAYDFEMEDVQSVSSLWGLFSDGFTPPTERIDLNLESSWHTDSDDGKYRTYVGLADTLDFLRLMKQDENERLFNQNVRTNLHSKVNDRIRDTYEETPETFWLGNNGIYIVCKKVTADGDLHHLTYPSVINGSQTLHAIAESNKRHPCPILVRILQMDIFGDPNLLDAVIRRTNSQNTMKLTNLFAHDRCQLNIARFLDQYKIFYERREKEWQNEKKSILTEYLPINIKDVAQWLVTNDRHIGLGKARSQVADLFEKNTYQRLFGRFDTNLRSPAYDSLSILVWSGLLIDNLPHYLLPGLRPFAKIGRLLLVKAISSSVCQSTTLQHLVPDLLREHRWGRRKVPQAVLKKVREILSHMVDLQQKEQRRDQNVDFSNFYKRDDLTKLAYEKCCSAARIRELSKALEQSTDKIR